MSVSVLRATEIQDVAVGVPDLEAAQSILGIVVQWREKLDVARREFGRQCVGIRNMHERVPSGDALLDVPRAIRHWRNSDAFHQDLGAASLHDAEEDVVRLRSLERDLESQAIAIERKRRRNVADDEE